MPCDDSMPPPVPSQHELDAIDGSADEDNSDGLISSNYTNSDTQKIPSYFHKNI